MDWFQINMNTFFMCALILGHQKMVSHIYQPIFQLF